MTLEQIRAFLHPLPADLVGTCRLDDYHRRFPEAGWRLESELPVAVVFGFPVMRPVLDTLHDGPNALYYSHYRQLNHALDKAALELAFFLDSAGYRALPLPASQTLDAHDRIAHASHRHLGYLAGLGWHGRNNLLIHPRLGAALRLVSVLTDAPLQPGTPVPSRCGACRACQTACPAGAIADEVTCFDLEACHRKLSEFRGIPRLGQRICGVCVSVCPGNHSPR